MLETLRIPGEDELISTAPGQVTALTGVNATLAAALACRAARAGKKTLLVMENDLKAARAADDARQLAGDAAFLPGGEIDLTRAAGSLENSWRRLEALSAVSIHGTADGPPGTVPGDLPGAAPRRPDRPGGADCAAVPYGL